MKNLYEQVYNRPSEDRKTNLHQAYSDVYNENEQVDDPDKPNVVVFYSYNSKGYEALVNLSSTEGLEIKSASMDEDYFRNRIEGRLEQAMYKTTELVIEQIFPITPDKVAFRGIYEILANNRVNNSTVTAIHSFKSGELPVKDHLIETVKKTSGFQVVDVGALLSNTFNEIVSTSGVKSDDTVKPDVLIPQLWDIKEVEGRTSVGRGELAMCMLSKAVKGSPGDVVTEEEPNEDLETDLATDTRVATDNIRLEVKGFGGRPGLGKYVDGFSRRVVERLKDETMAVSVTDREEVDKATRDRLGVDGSTQQVTVVEFFNKYFEGLPEQGIADLRALWVQFAETLNNYINPLATEFPTTTDDDFMKERGTFLSSLSTSDVLPGLVPKKGQWNSETNNFFKYESYLGPVHWRDICNILGETGYGKATRKGITKSKSIPAIAKLQRMGMASPAKAISKTTAFKDAVETLFRVVLPKAYNPASGINNLMLANIVAEARPEALDDTQHQSLVDVIEMAIESGRLDVFASQGNISTAGDSQLERAIGAVQLAAYCAADNFSHAMLVNDQPGVKGYPALIIETQAKNIATTWQSIYSAFEDNQVIVPLSIDAQNKGVQLKFSGGGR
ncbi:hypothetical protein OAU81_00370 [bacterium]|nr:hypothetical protein [bacterium]